MSEVLRDGGELIYETPNAVIYQCDRSEAFILIFNKEEIAFRLCDLIHFKRKVQQIDLTAMLLAEAPDVEVVYMAHCDRFLALTIYDILELKDLFAGTFTMLELNSLIHRQLVRRSV